MNTWIDPLGKGIAWLLGRSLYYFLPHRRRVLLSNLFYAYPQWTEKERVRFAKKNCEALIEMGIFALCVPFMSKKTLKQRLSITPAVTKLLKAQPQENRPTILLVPHCTFSESLCYLLSVYPIPSKIGAIYQPLRNHWINRWVLSRRQRYGAQLFSRHEGYFKAKSLLAKNGILSILFDQHAGIPGIQIPFLGRNVSASQLADLFFQYFKNAQIFFVYPIKQGFLKAKIHCEELKSDSTPLSLQSHLWLEKKLTEDKNFSKDWLWLHNRWKLYEDPAFCLSTQSYCKKSLSKQFPPEKKAIIWVRMPNWLGDIVMALPLLRALQKSRPEAHFQLLVKKEFIPLLQVFQMGDSYIELPNKTNGLSYFKHFWKLRKRYGTLSILLTNSHRGDIEAYLMGAKLRIGIKRKNSRPFLTHVWNSTLAQEHQTFEGFAFLKHFGLIARKACIGRLAQERRPFNPTGPQVLEQSFKGQNPAIMSQDTRPQWQHNLTPLGKQAIRKKGGSFVLGIFCGSAAKTFSKRWPASYWITLIQLLNESFPGTQFKFFGQTHEATLIQKIISGNKIQGTNLCGKTDFVTLIEELKTCHVVFANDSGGLHLANAVGCPTVGFFGPTTPQRSRPIFDAPKLILKKETLNPLDWIDPQECLQRFVSWIKEEEVSSPAKLRQSNPSF